MATEEPKMRDLREHVKQMGDARLAEAERDDLTSYHFAEAVRQLRVVRRLALAFSNEREDEMPQQIAQQVREVVRTAAELVDKMIGFQVEQPNAEQTHRQITQQVQTQYNTMVNNLRTNIRGNVESASAAARLDETNAKAETLLADIERTALKAEQLVNRGQTLNAEIAAGKLSSYYDTQAKNHRDASRNFLVAAGIAAVVVAVTAVILFATLDESKDAPWSAYARDLGVRIFGLGLGLYIVSFLVRSYRANQHLLVVNEHKANALKTFLLFQASADEGGTTRDLITAELVKAVFAADETGFLDNAPDRTVVEGQSGLIAMLAQRNMSG